MLVGKVASLTSEVRYRSRTYSSWLTSYLIANLKPAKIVVSHVITLTYNCITRKIEQIKRGKLSIIFHVLVPLNYMNK